MKLATQRLEPLETTETADPPRPRARARLTFAIRGDLIGHYSYLLNVARGIVRNDSDARDLVQDTYRRALEHEDQFVAGTNLRAWLTCILRNAHRDRLRRASFEILTPSAGDFLEAGSSFPSPEFAGVSAWRCVEDKDLALAMRRLPPIYRTIYTLREAGWAYTDIARQMGVSTNTVATRLHRARLWLRRALTDRRRSPAATSSPSSSRQRP